jgi:stearoyl-CoA desaturase (delta-9 desaturase)
MHLSEHFKKIVLPSYLLSIIAVYVLLAHFSWAYVIYSILGFYVIGIFGSSIGFHRYLAHQSFKTSRFWEVVMILLGSLSGQGSSIFWVSLHKHHHKFSDTDKDVHSPSRGIFNSFIGWQFFPLQSVITPANRFMYADPLIKFIHRNYYKFYWGVALALYLLNPYFALFFFTFGGFFLFGMIENLGNVIFHHDAIGYKNYDLHDNSRNVWWNSILTFGGGWHNNHHRWPGNYKFGEKWWEIDLSAKIIEMIKK